MLKNSGVDDSKLALSILSRLLINEESLEQFTIPEARHVFEWALENLLAQKIMQVEDWLETAYHLCKQRWDSSIEWLEIQPVPKVLLMIDIVNKHVKSQQAEMKKSSNKKK